MSIPPNQFRQDHPWNGGKSEAGFRLSKKRLFSVR